VGRPQNRNGIGDVDLIFDRYAESRASLIEVYRSQPWFTDGLSRDEALFVERGISFVARYDGPRFAQVPQTSIERKLYKYEKVHLSKGDVEVLLIYRSGDDADRQITMIRQMLPVLEELVGVQFPEKVLTIVNGNFEVNDFNDGQFIRIASCCVTSPFILAHELAHAYWSMGPAWLNEGMADLYANFMLMELNDQAPAGWRRVAVDLDSYYRARQSSVSRRFPDLLLSQRVTSSGLYEAADVFLLDIRATLGEPAFLRAAGDVYRASDFGRYILRDKRIQDTFMAHASEEGRAQLMELFNRSVWGDNGERYRELQELEAS
jgi:hypothetical protein